MLVRNLKSSHLWWLAIFVILICAALLRYTGYNFSLPFIDHVDEPAYNIAARMVIDNGSPKPIGMQGYPSGIIAVNYVLLRLFQDPSTPPSTILWMVRLLSITCAVLTVLFVGLLGRLVATPITGIVAAALWTFEPAIVENSRFATADSFVTLFTISSVYFVLSGARYQRSRFVSLSMIALMLGIVFKYQALFVLPVTLLVAAIPLVYLRGHERKQFFLARVQDGVLLALFFFWLILLFPALEATSSPLWSAPTERLGFPTPQVILENVQVVYNYLGSSLFWMIGFLGLGFLFVPEYRKRVYLTGVFTLVLAAAAWMFGVSLYGSLGIQQFRQFIAFGAFVVILLSIGLTGWIFVLSDILQRVASPLADRRWMVSTAAVLALVFFFILPDINASIADAINHTLPDRRNDLMSYMDTSVEPGAYISGHDNHKTFNGAWGGYTGIYEFPFIEMASLNQRNIQEWRDLSVSYAIISYLEYEALSETELQELTVLKIFPPSSEYRGPDMVVVRLHPIQYQAEGSLGSIRLVGYDLNSHEISPGETLDLRLYWQADAPLESSYAVFNHLIHVESGELAAQGDGDPLLDLRRGTNLWNDPTETLMSRQFVITTQDDIPPGRYQLMSGFYHRETGQRLMTPEGSDHIVVAEITVEAAN